MGLSIINHSLFYFLGILISKQIAPASLFPFQLRIKTPFLKNITDDSIIFFMEVKCKGSTQITHMEETKKHHRVIRLWIVLENLIFCVLHPKSFQKETKWFQILSYFKTDSCPKVQALFNNTPRFWF